MPSLVDVTTEEVLIADMNTNEELMKHCSNEVKIGGTPPRSTEQDSEADRADEQKLVVVCLRSERRGDETVFHNPFMDGTEPEPSLEGAHSVYKIRFGGSGNKNGIDFSTEAVPSVLPNPKFQIPVMDHAVVHQTFETFNTSKTFKIFVEQRELESGPEDPVPLPVREFSSNYRFRTALKNPTDVALFLEPPGSQEEESQEVRNRPETEEVEQDLVESDSCASVLRLGIYEQGNYVMIYSGVRVEHEIHP